MPFTSNVKYLWPPNFTEGSDTMNPHQRRIAVRFTGTSTDASNASDEVIIDKSDLQGPAGAEPTTLAIEEVEWSVKGYDAVIIEWDDGTDEEALRLSGAGFKNYKDVGALYSDGSSETGDLLLTTQGGAANSAYDISMVIRLKE